MKKILNFNEIDELAYKLIEVLGDKEIIALIGDLGTGKTTFVKKLAEKLNIKETVKSPTFTYVIEYHSGIMPLYHFDVYRISDPEEVYEIGFEDYLTKEGLIVIEWADIIIDELPKEFLCIRLDHNNENSRSIDIEYIGNKEKNKEILTYVGFGD